MKEEHDLKELNKGKKKIQEKKSSDRSRIKTEKVIMLASSVMLLSGLTATGIYFKANEKPAEQLKIDLSGMEENIDQKATEILQGETVENPMNIANSDLDYDPEWKEDAGISNEELKTDLVSGTAIAQTHVEDIEAQLDDFLNPVESEDSSTESEAQEQLDIVLEDTESDSTVSAKAYETAELSFSEEDTLAWPIVGTVLMDYSMDATVYYKTLDQYRYQPGMVIGANKGETITAAATCQVTEIDVDPVLGNTVKMNLGGGYELLYGQLENIKVAEGDILHAGDIVGAVADPTKYYSVEGTNLFIEVTKDGVPVNPMTLLP